MSTATYVFVRNKKNINIGLKKASYQELCLDNGVIQLNTFHISS